jgi:hypothetical protein
MVVDLRGFEDEQMRFSRPSQFLFQRNGATVVTIFGDEGSHPVADGEPSTRFHFPKEGMKEIGGIPVGVLGNESLWYHVYYRGFCFQFHFTTTSDPSGEALVEKVLKSIRFVDGKVNNAKAKRMIYIGNRRMQMTIPESWNYSVNNDGTSGKGIPTMAFQMTDNNTAKMLLSPVKGFNPADSDATVENIKAFVSKNMSEISAESVNVPVMKKTTGGKATVYYFDAEDKGYSPNKKEDYPWLRQGALLENGAAIYFTIFYHSQTEELADKALDALSNVSMLRLTP